MQHHVVLSGQIIDGCVEEAVAHIALRHHEIVKSHALRQPQLFKGIYASGRLGRSGALPPCGYLITMYDFHIINLLYLKQE